MIDILYKYLRKKLSSNVYRAIQYSPFGRAKNWEQIETYRNIFLKYKSEAGDGFKNRIVLEVGSGNQIFTALFFLLAGAKKVLLVDPKIKISSEMIKSSINELKSFSHEYSVFEDNLKERLLTFTEMNIIPDEYNSSIDNVFSHLVLEHFDNLPTYFQNTSRLISENGFSYNIVDLSDHTYHIFDKYKMTKSILRKRALFHLRYSDKNFRRINDSRCYMNRLLLPVYYELAEENNLEVKLLDKSRYFGATKIHNDVLSKFQSRNPDDIYITSFRILLRGKGQGGTPTNKQ